MEELVTVEAALRSLDGSTKYLLRGRDGHAFEGVRFRANGVLNLCLSSQIGCAMSCRHCATGFLPLKRNLSRDEILAEAEIMAENEPYDVLFLGMGEPFLNLEAVLQSMHGMVASGGTHSFRNVLIGTSGVPAVSTGLRRIATLAERPYLSFSIHGYPDEIRQRIIPHARSYNLRQLGADVHWYCDATGDEVTFNYNPIAGVNDADETIDEFASWARDFRCVVRLIPWNPVPQTSFVPSGEDAMRRIFERLEHASVRFIYRPNHGTDTMGGCGQLGLLGYGNRVGTE